MEGAPTHRDPSSDLALNDLGPSDTSWAAPPDASLVERAIETFFGLGHARLGRLVPQSILAELRRRIDAMMLGELRYPGLFFQRDTDTGSYGDLSYGKGWEGPTLRYRKLEKVELDPFFADYMRAPLFRALTEKAIGREVTLYRATVFNKAGETGGSDLPWHQDGGEFWGLDREPIFQAWTAIDDAPLGGGCLEVVEKSHLAGLATPLGGVVPQDHVDRGDADARAIALPAVAGEVILVHNHLWHRSNRSTTGKARRGLTLSFMDAATRCRRKKRAPREFFRVF